MTCETIELTLVDFQLAAVDEETRARIEAHLLECNACLKSYLALKRNLETAENEPAPSPTSRARLRAAVAEHLHPSPKPWRWWEQPLAFGFATAALVVALLITQSIASGPGAAPRTLAGAQHRTFSP